MKDDYYNKTLDLATSNADEVDVFSKDLSNNRKVIYRKLSNDLVFTQDGEITSLYKPKFGKTNPDAGYKYFEGLK